MTDLRSRLGRAPAWHAGERFASLDGLERVRMMMDGGVPLPPAYLLVGLRPVEAEVGRVVYELAPSGWLHDDVGCVAPGALAYFADAPGANAVHTVLPANRTLRTVALSVEFVARRESGPILGEGVVLPAGGDDGLATLTLVGDDGAFGGGSCRALMFDHHRGEDTQPVEPVGAATTLDLDDPAPARPVGARSGITQLERIISGAESSPPFWGLMQISPVEVESGRVVMSMVADEWLSSPASLLFGGALAGFATESAWSVMRTADSDTERTRLLDVTYNFTRGVEPDGTLVTSSGHLVHRGRTMAVTDTELHDSKGRLVGLARCTGLVEPI